MMFILLICLLLFVARSQGQWDSGHATFYDKAGGAACGFNTNGQGYGNQITALSEALLGGRDGAQCGACYEIMCVGSNCNHGVGTIKVTATDFCPSSSGPYAWCNPPQKHFDLSEAMYTKLVPRAAGRVQVNFRRIPCAKSGGVRFQINEKTNDYWVEILIHNVGGNGVVSRVLIKGSRTGWMPMKREWGQNWVVSSQLRGQALSFQVNIVGDTRTLLFNNVVPPYWRNGQSFDGQINF